MKTSVCFLLLCMLPFFSWSQIHFVEITKPDDFSIENIFTSPTGEFFTQAASDVGNVYTSPDGLSWTKTALPAPVYLENMIFFKNGIPIIQTERNGHLIRRNGSWHLLNSTPSFENVQATFIVGDTLFVYEDIRFSYSLNYGETYTTIFTYGEPLPNHTAQLWKTHQHLILHHTGGASDYLSVFDLDGERVLEQEFYLSFFETYFSDCGNLVFYDFRDYVLLQIEDLFLQEGASDDLFPNPNDRTIAHGAIAYQKSENIIYRMTDCNFTWETYSVDDTILAYDRFWVNETGDIYLYNLNDNRYLKQISGSGVWTEHEAEIDEALIRQIDESYSGSQFCSTPNHFFYKTIASDTWIVHDTIQEENSVFHYSPVGDLYLFRDNHILYSADNGVSFHTIQIPVPQFGIGGHTFRVLDNGILYLLEGILGNAYISTDNGSSWANIGFAPNRISDVKLIGDYVYIIQDELIVNVTRINILTLEIESPDLSNFINFNFNPTIIGSDGSLYFIAFDQFEPEPEALFRYNFDTGIEYVGVVPDITWVDRAFCSGHYIIGISGDDYFTFDGKSIHVNAIQGLNFPGVRHYYLASNQHLYAKIASNRLFRSTEPLSFPNAISGTLYLDENQSCISNTAFQRIPRWNIQIENDEIHSIRSTGHDGTYSISLPEGTYTMRCQPANFNWEVCQTEYEVTIDDQHPTIQQDFLARAIGDCAGLHVVFSTPLLRRCFDNRFYIRVWNAGPGDSHGTTLHLHLDSFFINPQLSVPFTVSGKIVTVELGVIPTHEEISFTLDFNLSCDADFGAEHCLTGILDDENICETARSHYTECQTNIGAFDPNDKRTFNANGQETTRVDKGEYIYYHVRFQNTGTDTAFNIRVVDPLDHSLDISTLEMLSSSHPYTYEINDGPDLVVYFKDALLVDSTTNEPGSHGYFKFRIKPLPGHEYGTTIENSASIYFDFNAPVVTNQVMTSILPPLTVYDIEDGIDFRIFPSPATTYISLDFEEADAQRIQSYLIIDATGRTVMSSSDRPGKRIDLHSIPGGIYHVLLKNNERYVGGKFFVKL